MKNFLINGSIVFASIIFSLVFAEIVLRIVLPDPRIQSEPGPITEEHDLLAVRIIPSQESFLIDKNGFKNTVINNEYRIVALGDSHTYGGHTKKDTFDISWPHQLGSLINEKIYNMGVWGYGPVEYHYLFQQALTFNPEIVVVGVYLGNDLFNAYDSTYHKDAYAHKRNPLFIDPNPQTTSDLKQVDIPFRSIRDAFRDHSVLYAFLGNKTRIIREHVGLSKPVTIGTEDWDQNDSDVAIIYNERPDQKTMHWVGHRLPGVDMSDVRVQEGWRITESLFRDIAEQAYIADTKLVIALIPTKISAYESLVAEAELKNESYDKVISNEKNIRISFLSLCEEIKIKCIDMAPALQENLLDGEVLYRHDRDGHPNERGYAVYAEIIHKAINDLLNK